MKNRNFPTKEDNTLANKYTITRKLKSGGFGSVYYAKGLNQQQRKYAVKLTNKVNERYCNIEKNIYKLLQQKKFTFGFVKYIQYGMIYDLIYQVMELIGYDLEEIMTRTKNKKFSIKTTLMIGLQVIDRIQALHSIDYVHRDIKPDNLAIGSKQKNNVIYMLDFGLAIKNDDSMPNYQKGKMIGTLCYMSVRQHQTKKATFFDDIQSFVYTLIYLIQGTLPWLNIKINSATDANRVKAIKLKLDKEWFAKNKIPIQILQILEIARNRNEKPSIDYLNIKYKLLQALKQIGQQNDFNFDWKGILRITHDSPEKRAQQRQKILKANQQQQKQVQNEIFQIYKFMKDEKYSESYDNFQGNSLKQVKKISQLDKSSKKKLQKGQILSFKRDSQAQKQNYIQSSKQEFRQPQQRRYSKQQKQTKQQRTKRPQSSKPISQERPQRGYTQKQALLKKIQQEQLKMKSMFGNGPKIAINYTTNYKL